MKPARQLKRPWGRLTIFGLQLSIPYPGEVARKQSISNLPVPNRPIKCCFEKDGFPVLLFELYGYFLRPPVNFHTVVPATGCLCAPAREVLKPFYEKLHLLSGVPSKGHRGWKIPPGVNSRLLCNFYKYLPDEWPDYPAAQSIQPGGRQ